MREGSGGTIGRRGGYGTCDTCAMTLLVPGLLRGGRRYCCRGCATGGTGSLCPPARWSVGVARSVRVAASPDDAIDLLADVEMIPLYEPKVGRVRLTAVDGGRRNACATVDGRFLGLPYRIQVHFEALGGGVRSTLSSGGLVAGLRGIFAVRPDHGGTLIVHSERYQFRGGPLGRWLGRLALPYIGWSMDRELRRLKRLIEDPSALGEALRA